MPRNRGGHWRVSWIETTGELYAIHLGFDEFFVIAVADTQQQADDLMRGWEKTDNDLDAMLTQIDTRLGIRH